MRMTQQQFNELVYWTTFSMASVITESNLDASFTKDAEKISGGSVAITYIAMDRFYAVSNSRWQRLGDDFDPGQKIESDDKFVKLFLGKENMMTCGKRAAQKSGLQLPEQLLLKLKAAWELANQRPGIQPTQALLEQVIEDVIVKESPELAALLIQHTIASKKFIVEIAKEMVIQKLNQQFKTNYAYTHDDAISPSLLLHYLDVYGATTASSLILLITAGFIAATVPASGFALAGIGTLLFLSTYLLSKDVVHFGYRFFKLPKFVESEIPTQVSEIARTTAVSTQEPIPDEQYLGHAVAR